jgi:trehalose 6-phosphate phosphatase
MDMGADIRRPLGGSPPPDNPDIKRTAFLLDVDGTILDIAATPSGVVVSQSLRTTLKRLLEESDQGVAFVSGRTIRDLDHLFTPLNYPTIGGHGAEMRVTVGGPIMKRYRAPLTESLRRQLCLLVTVDRRILVEDKSYSIAVHYRLALEQEAFLRNKVAAIVSADLAGNVEVLHGKAVIEIKSAPFTKGSAVRELMTHPPFAGRSPVFIGDDTTDESVFAILPQLGGRGYSVGKTVPGVQGMFASPEDVRGWLAQLCAGGGAGHE